MLGFTLLTSLLGCAASVTADAIDGGFGPGTSAFWYAGQGYAGIVIVTVADGCKKEQDMMAALTDYMDYVTESSMDGSYSCKGVEEPLMNYLDAAEAYYVADMSAATFSAVKLDEGDLDIPKDASGYVSHSDEAIDLSAYDDFDPNGDVMDSCGVGSDSGEFETDGWTLDDGTLTIDSSEAEGKASGSAEAAMLDAKGKDDGDFSATFTASWCDLDL